MNDLDFYKEELKEEFCSLVYPQIEKELYNYLDKVNKELDKKGINVKALYNAKIINAKNILQAITTSTPAEIFVDSLPI